MRRMVLIAAAALTLAGCVEDEEAGPGANAAAASCLDAPEAANQSGPAVVALHSGLDRNPSELHGPVARLVRISLPGGAVEARRPLGPRWKRGDIDRLDSVPLRLASGPLLAPTRDGRSVLALLEYPVSGRFSVAVVDARTLRVRCSHPLERDILYGSLMLGRSGTVYAVGVRDSGRSRWDAMLTMVDADTGKLLGTHTLREADQTKRVRSGKGWWAYSAALRPDERRLVVTWHGGDTTGADSFRVWPGSRVSGEAPEPRCPAGLPRVRCPARTDADLVHGGVAPARAGFVAASGTNTMVRLDRRGRDTGRFHVKGQVDHLMDFEVDAERRLVYVSACGARPGIRRVELDRRGLTSVRSGDFCGSPLAVHDDRFLVLGAARVNRSGYRGFRTESLRLLDLRRPGAGRAIPGSEGPLDAVVVGTPR